MSLRRLSNSGDAMILNRAETEGANNANTPNRKARISFDGLEPPSHLDGKIIPLSEMPDHYRGFDNVLKDAVLNPQRGFIRGTTFEESYSRNRMPVYQTRDPFELRDQIYAIVQKHTPPKRMFREEQHYEEVGPYFKRPLREWVQKRLWRLYDEMPEASGDHIHEDVADAFSRALEFCTNELKSKKQYYIDAGTKGVGGKKATKHILRYQRMLTVAETISDTESGASGGSHVKTNKNIGWPFYKKNWATKVVSDEQFFKEFKEVTKFPGEWSDVSGLTGKQFCEQWFKSDPTGRSLREDLPYVMYCRSTPKGKEANERGVQNPCALEKFVGARIRYPVTRFLQGVGAFVGLNGIYVMDEYPNPNDKKTQVNGPIKDIWPEVKSWISADISGFDSSCRGLAFNTTRQLIRVMLESENNAAYNDELDEVLDNLFTYYAQGSLISPLGLIRENDHGLFSGCNLTTIIGCLWSWVMFTTGMFYLGISLDDYFSWHFGDDTLLCLAGDHNPNEVSLGLEKCLRHFGLRFNADKSEVDKCKFLAHDFDYDIGWNCVYPIMRVAPGLIWMGERPEELRENAKALGGVDIPGTVDLIALSIVGRLDIISRHPAWEPLVRFIREGHPTRLRSTTIIHGIAQRFHILGSTKFDNQEEIKSPTLDLILRLEALEGVDGDTMYQESALTPLEVRQVELILEYAPSQWKKKWVSRQVEVPGKHGEPLLYRWSKGLNLNGDPSVNRMILRRSEKMITKICHDQGFVLSEYLSLPETEECETSNSNG